MGNPIYFFYKKENEEWLIYNYLSLQLMQEVILVNEQDEQIGTMEKMRAHQEGKLHRAFSVFLFNDKGEILLQKRAATKYHSPNLWTNSCCSHPAPNESLEAATQRRLKEECNLSDIELKKEFSFIYKTTFENGLIEHELDYVFSGKTNIIPHLNEEEASDYRYVSIDNVENEISASPEKFTYWFRLALPQLVEKMKATIS